MAKTVDINKLVDSFNTLKVVVQGDDVWLTQKQIAEVFQVNIRTINEHIQNIIQIEELSEDLVIRKFRIIGDHREILHYTQEMVYHIGYRINGPVGIQFRTWCTQLIETYRTK